MPTFEVTCAACGELRWPGLPERPATYTCTRCTAGVGAGRREAGRRGAAAKAEKKARRSQPQTAGGAIVSALALVLLSAGAAEPVTGTWQLHSTTETAVEVERSLTPCDSPSIAFRKIATLPAGTTTFVDPTVQSGQVACYRVRTINAAGASSYSNAAESGSPEPPGDFTLTPSPASATWTLCAAENAMCSFSGTKEVRYGDDSGGYVSAFVTDGVPCDNTRWTDPVPGVVKHCDTR